MGVVANAAEARGEAQGTERGYRRRRAQRGAAEPRGEGSSAERDSIADGTAEMASWESR